jgi:flagellar L-ring protein FlgH
MRRLFVAVLVVLTAGLARADSLFSDQTERQGSLIANSQPIYKPGDIITVVVRETVNAQTQANTNTKKESDVSASAPPLQNPFLIAETPGGLNIIPAEQLPNWDIGIENEHKASGQTRRTNTLVMTITCFVKEVHENGNLTIEGRKRVTVNREDSSMVVKGVIRSRDVTPANTIESSQVANAEIELKGQGPLWNTQRRGIITKILDWFSPF